jgi:lysophospholipase L1-like esterase
MRRLPVVLPAVALAVVLAGCSGSSDETGPTGSPGYVAIGDSFTSGPGIAPGDTDQPGCLRSLSNYPHLVAAEQTLTLTDVSCGGEDTTMLRDGRTLDDGTVVEPQLASIGRDTTVVTVGIGANDGSATAGLYTYCLLPASAGDDQCRTFTKGYMPDVLKATREHVVEVLDEVRERAPEADVRLVGYLRIAPDEGAATCPGLTLGADRTALVAGHEKALNATLEQAAKQAGVPFVDLYAASEGHDACAGEQAWVNGLDDASATGDGAFLHPTAAGMRAAADALQQQLGR